MLKIFSLLFVTIFIWQLACAENVVGEIENSSSETRIVGIDPADFVMIDKKKYYISTEFGTFLQAVNLCMDVGYRIVSLETLDKNDVVQRYLLDNALHGNGYWTSAQKVGTTWQWSTCSAPFNFVDWDLSEPNYNGTVTAGMYVKNGSWFDEGSNLSYRFICEWTVSC